MSKRLTLPNLAAAFLLLAVAARGYAAGELATLWLVGIAYAGGLLSGLLLASGILGKE